METLGQSEPYFVKCIRSNADKVNGRPTSGGGGRFSLRLGFSFSSLASSVFLHQNIFASLCLCVSSAASEVQRQPGAETAALHRHARDGAHPPVGLQHQVQLQGNRITFTRLLSLKAKRHAETQRQHRLLSVASWFNRRPSLSFFFYFIYHSRFLHLRL